MQYAPTVRVCPSASAAPKQGPNTSEASGLVAHILPFVLGVCWGSSLDTLAQQQPTALRHSPDIRQYSDFPADTFPFDPSWRRCSLYKIGGSIHAQRVLFALECSRIDRSVTSSFTLLPASVPFRRMLYACPTSSHAMSAAWACSVCMLYTVVLERCLACTAVCPFSCPF